MKRYIEGWDRRQVLLLPERIGDYVDENNSVRVIEAFVDRLILTDLRFDRSVPAETGRPAYHPAALLQLYIYGPEPYRLGPAPLKSNRGRRQ